MPHRRRERQKERLVESEQAILDANKSLRDVVSREAEVRRVSGALREIRKRNHFAEQLRIVIERG